MTKSLIFSINKVKNPINIQNKKRKSWTKQEDELILNLSKTLPRKEKWILISKKIKTKTPLECYRRLKSIDPKFKKGRWTPQEDFLLLQLVNQFGRCWNIISKIFKNRSNKQVKIRYDEYINPKICFDKFNGTEDDLIIKLYPIYLNKWSKYQSHLPNRSQKRIKLRYLFLTSKNNNVANSDNYSYSTTSDNNFFDMKNQGINEQEICDKIF